MKKQLRIAVLYGGDSTERDVSLDTGEAVAAGLDACGHYVRLIDVRNGCLDPLDGVGCDVVFIALHGTFGEDGQVQMLLERRGLPYTGSGVDASRLAMDKPAAKERFTRCGVPTPPYFVLEETMSADERRATMASMGFPQIIKPAREGSSVGVTFARSMPDAVAGVERCFELDCRVLVEQHISGRELTVGILGSRALPVIEVIYPTPIFDKHAKYAEGVTQHVIDPELPVGVMERVRVAARNAHRALGCRDISRVDLILSADNVPQVLEVNTVPGMTATSLVPDAARAAGIEFPQLCEVIAMHALRRTAIRENSGRGDR